MRSIGLDVHRDFCEVAIVEAGDIRSAGRIETTPAALELFARSLCGSDRVALEVTGNAWEVARILEAAALGINCCGASPGCAAAIRQRRSNVAREKCGDGHY